MTKRIIALSILMAAVAWLSGGCGSSETTHVPDPGATDTLFTDLEFGGVATFDIVTWNIENFTYNPYTHEEDAHRVERIRYVVDAVKAFSADVVALQEITSNTSFQAVLADLEGWDGYRSSEWSSWHELAFIWNTATITVTSEPYTIFEGDWNSFPRAPLILECSYQDQPLVIINNHLKCCGNNVIDVDYDDEERRRLDAVTLLEQWIRDNHPDSAVILLGDLNDSLTDSPSANVFNVILDAPGEYVFADMSLATGSSSSWSYRTSHIDHIMLTDELFAPLDSPAAEVVTLRLDHYLQSGWNEYETNLSDHLPVGLKLPIGP